MLTRSSRQDAQHSPCTCLLEAFRAFPAQAEHGHGCAAPDCALRNLDSITVQGFLEAVRGRSGADVTEDRLAEDRVTLPIFRAIARARRRR